MNHIIKPCSKCIHYIAPKINKQYTLDGGFGLCHLFQHKTDNIINYKSPPNKITYEYAIVARTKALTLCGGKYFFEKNKAV